jgi:hypothetical protein
VRAITLWVINEYEARSKRRYLVRFETADHRTIAIEMCKRRDALNECRDALRAGATDVKIYKLVPVTVTVKA